MQCFIRIFHSFTHCIYQCLGAAHLSKQRLFTKYDNRCRKQSPSQKCCWKLLEEVVCLSLVKLCCTQLRQGSDVHDHDHSDQSKLFSTFALFSWQLRVWCLKLKIQYVMFSSQWFISLANDKFNSVDHFSSHISSVNES